MKFLILAALFLLSAPPIVPADMLRCTTKDWTLAAKAAEAVDAPLLVLYTADDCNYCERLKREVLEPLFGHEQAKPLAVVREVDINTGGKMTDFDGELIRSRLFKKRYQIFATPTLLILDSSGRLLARPLVGYNSKNEYIPQLESLLEESGRAEHAAVLQRQSAASFRL